MYVKDGNKVGVEGELVGNFLGNRFDFVFKFVLNIKY